MAASRHFVFTINNPKDWDTPQEWLEKVYADHNPAYLCFGREKAPTTGTPHFQGYIQFPKLRRFATLATKLGAAFFNAKGSAEEASAYCRKDEDFYEIGTMLDLKRHGGKRRCATAEACVEIRDAIKAKRPRHELLEEYPHLTSHVNALCDLRPVRVNKPELIYIWGSTGHGKSTTTKHTLLDLGYDMNNQYWKPSADKWWPRYAQQPVVILEEFTSCFSATSFLQMCDSTPYHVQFKGGYTTFDSPYIIILTNMALENQYVNLKDDEILKLRWDAYYRRINDGHVLCTDSLSPGDVAYTGDMVQYRRKAIADFIKSIIPVFSE